MFPDGLLATFDTTRLVEDVLAIPGHLIFDGEQLVEAHLNELHPHASHVAADLERLMEHFGNPFSRLTLDGFYVNCKGAKAGLI
jgi:hypothetical protein